MINFKDNYPNIYWERQKGNNCRIHSLNAYFGFQKITEHSFENYCNEYDMIIPGLKSIKMDGFAECRSIISFIIDKYHNKFVQLVPINLRNVHKKNRDEWNYDRFTEHMTNLRDGILGYFEFNKDHVWYNKKIDGKWYKIDSLSGISEINHPKKFGENGYLLIFEKNLILNEIYFLIDLIKKKDLLKNNAEIDIAIYNLYHLLNKVKFEYSVNNEKLNANVSLLKTLFSIITEYIRNIRKIRINKLKLDKYIMEIKNTINSFR